MGFSGIVWAYQNSRKCTEQNIAGNNMLRVDVPETTGQPAFTRFFGSSAIYSINPIDETTVRAMAERMQVQPIDSFNLSAMMEKHNALKQIGNMLIPSDDDEELNDYDDDDMDERRAF